MPVAGGLLADRFLGFTRAVIVGGVLMMFGHLVLGVETLPFFYSGLVLLATGSGLLKPNVSTLVGNLYRDRPQLRDQGFNIYYMGVNIGAFIAPLSVSWLRTHYGWSIAFMSAAVAMVLSLITFVTFKRYVAEADVKVDETSVGCEDTPAGRGAIARRSRCSPSSASRSCSGLRSTRSSTHSRSGRATAPPRHGIRKPFRSSSHSG